LIIPRLELFQRDTSTFALVQGHFSLQTTPYAKPAKFLYCSAVSRELNPSQSGNGRANRPGRFHVRSLEISVVFQRIRGFVSVRGLLPFAYEPARFASWPMQSLAHPACLSKGGFSKFLACSLRSARRENSLRYRCALLTLPPAGCAWDFASDAIMQPKTKRRSHHGRQQPTRSKDQSLSCVSNRVAQH